MQETVQKTNSESKPEIQSTTFPTNLVELPSGGLLYPEDHPLRKSLVELKFMTAKEENILTTESYINQGVVIDKFLQSMILSPKFNYDSLLICDKDALVIASRIYGYGEMYNIEVTAPSGRKMKVAINLSELKFKEIDRELMANGNNFTYQYSNKIGSYTIEFKLLSVGDQKQIETKLKKYRQAGSADTQITTRLQQTILSVNGNSDPGFIRLFIDNEFLASDSRKFREYIASIQPGLNLEIELEDEDTGEPFRTDITLGPSLLWPDARL